jgi:two-component system chemotaxis response regulator CheY
MMNKPDIVCIDDQREILAALKRDLEVLEGYFSIVMCESAQEAHEVLDEIDAEGGRLALIICDHVMPGKSGIDFMTEVNEDPRFADTKKILLTGLATHQDTIVAINRAGIDHYVEKPWESPELLGTIKILLTRYIISSGMNYQSCLSVLDQPTLYKELGARI